MKFVFLVILFLAVVPFARSQDERFFRQLFTRDISENQKIDKVEYKNKFHSKEYYLDLSGDNKKESLIFSKRDNEDWVEIYNQNRDKIFEYRFEEKAPNSIVYKIVKTKISEKTEGLIIYYFEGENKYIDFESSARIYIMTIDNNDLKTISIFKGPSIFEELKYMKTQYHLRNYNISTQDLNQDGVKELIVEHRGLSQVYRYIGNGKWNAL